MGYDIYIGEARMRVAYDEKEDEFYRDLDIVVDRFEHPEAPRFPGDGLTEGSNHRAPSYGGWAEFLRQAGLHDLFLGRDGEQQCLMQDHPGAKRLFRSDLELIRGALRAWQARPWPTKERIAGWDPTHDPFSRDDPDPRYDGGLARLLWLEWWVEWALTNCKVPTLYNR